MAFSVDVTVSIDIDHSEEIILLHRHFDLPFVPEIGTWLVVERAPSPSHPQLGPMTVRVDEVTYDVFRGTIEIGHNYECDADATLAQAAGAMIEARLRGAGFTERTDGPGPVPGLRRV